MFVMCVIYVTSVMCVMCVMYVMCVMSPVITYDQCAQAEVLVRRAHVERRAKVPHFNLAVVRAAYYPLVVETGIKYIYLQHI